MRVAALHRYPVKSMLGEQVEQAAVGQQGLAGDRRLALVERDTGLVVSAKQARKWGRLLGARAWVGDDGGIRLDLPDGRSLTTGDPDADEVLSGFAGRPVALSATPPAGAQLERWWPGVEGLAPPEAIARCGTVTPMAAAAPGTFFDYAPVHLVTTAALAALRERVPGSDYDAARFRPNIVVEAAGNGFVENDWPGRRVSVGASVVLDVITVTPRCAVPALAHGDLPADIEVLRGVVAANRLMVGDGRFACVGVYARVVAPGVVRTGDEVSVS